MAKKLTSIALMGTLCVLLSTGAQAVVFSSNELAYGSTGSAVRTDTGTDDVKNTLYRSFSAGTNIEDVSPANLGFSGIFNEFSNVNALSSGDDTVLSSTVLNQGRTQMGFSVSTGSLGALGSAVRAEAGKNAGDIYRYMGVSGVHELLQQETQLGLDDGSTAPGGLSDDLDAMDSYGASFIQETSWLNDPSPSIYLSIDGSEDIYVSDGHGGLTQYKDGVNDIGLFASDDIDALLLNVAQGWAAFSLSANSTTVISTSVSAADVLITNFSGSYGVLLTAAELGLEATDNIDALESIVPAPPVASLLLIGVIALFRRRFSQR